MRVGPIILGDLVISALIIRTQCWVISEPPEGGLAQFFDVGELTSRFVRSYTASPVAGRPWVRR